MKLSKEDIDVKRLAHLPSLLKEYGLEGRTLVDLTIGADGMIYLLTAGVVPEREGGMFVPTQAKTDWKALAVTADWWTGELLAYHMLDFGPRKINFHFIQPLGDFYLLLGARARLYKDGSFDKNAVVLDRFGSQVASFCLGDGIQQCMVDDSGCIVTSYFDEGVFGNFGWDDPVGKNGLVLWSREGDKLWENRDGGICDCYAINLDEKDRLWYYYYTDFDLVRTDYQTYEHFDPGIRGSSAFLIGKYGVSFLFQGGYREQNHFYKTKLVKGKLTRPRECAFRDEYEEAVQVERLCFRKSKVLLLDKQGFLSITDWIG